MKRMFLSPIRKGIEHPVAFKPSDEVCALIEVKNEGMYPHREIGERLVQPGDAGIVRETSACFGETYYAVEFVARAVVVAMHADDMIRTATIASFR